MLSKFPILDLLIQMLAWLRLANFILFRFKIYSRSYGYEKKFFIEQNKIWLRLAHAALG